MLTYSLIIPVYNRPEEIDELLESLTRQTYINPFEVIVVEDGSDRNCGDIIEKYIPQLQLKYFLKNNTGAGLSRNYGMQQATGNYFIVLDSDVIVPEKYLENVDNALQKNYTDTFGAPDAAHESFTDVQKAINYAMTSFLTTGGLRGGKNKKADFQPRSFNMGISKKAFEATGGFSGRKIGEDIELSFRMKNMNFTSQLIPEAYVYHKRRSTFMQFLKQTYRFGKERPLLNQQFPKTGKLTYWFPSLFVLGLFTSIILLIFKCFLPAILASLYLFAIFIHSSYRNKSIKIGFMSVIATLVQFLGYGSGFLKSTFLK